MYFSIPIITGSLNSFQILCFAEVTGIFRTPVEQKFTVFFLHEDRPAITIDGVTYEVDSAWVEHVSVVVYAGVSIDVAHLKTSLSGINMVNLGS